MHDVANQAGQTPVDIARERDQIDVEALFTRHTPSRSASCISLPQEEEDDEDESWSPPAKTPRSPGARQLFTLESRHSSQCDSDSDSDWSQDDEAHLASESERERHSTRLSRNASTRSFPMERSCSTSDSSKSSEKSKVKSRSSKRGSPQTTAHSLEDPSSTLQSPSAWRSCMSASRIASRFSQLKLPTPPSLHSWRGIASAAMSSSPSAASISLSSLASSPATAPESDAEPTNWPASLLYNLHLPASKSDNSGVRASLGRRLGYSIDHITEDALRSYSYHAQKYGGTLRKDKM